MQNLKFNTLYSAQFNPHPIMKILEKAQDEGFYKVLLYPYDGQGEAVVRVVEEYVVKMLCFREYDPSLKSLPYEGTISDEDLETVQDFFSESITKEMIRSAIGDYNWGGDWNEILEGFGISGDTCNREFVVQCVEKKFNLKSEY